MIVDVVESRRTDGEIDGETVDRTEHGKQCEGEVEQGVVARADRPQMTTRRRTVLLVGQKSHPRK